MPEILARKTVLLAKIQPTPTTDSIPTGAANAILTSGLTMPDMQSTLVKRNLDRPTLGGEPQVHFGVHNDISFGVEIAGAGVAGVAPNYGPLLRACGRAEIILAAPEADTAQAGAASSITLAVGASTVDDAYQYLQIRTLTGTGAGQTAYCKSYIGTTKVLEIFGTWDTNPDATTTYSIDAQVAYVPVSTGFEMLSLYPSVDGQRHPMTDVRGNFSMKFATAENAMFNFTMKGLWVDPTSVADPVPDWSCFAEPLAVGNGNGTFKLHGAAYNMSSLDLDLGNQFPYRNVVGQEAVRITDRDSTGSLVIDAPDLATKNFFTTAKANTLGAIEKIHGIAPGNTVVAYTPFAQLLQPKYGNADDLSTLEMGLAITPSDAGNDEMIIIVK